MAYKCCVVCEAKVRVKDSRNEKYEVIRRYECANGHRFSTVELWVPCGDSGRVERKKVRKLFDTAMAD